MDFKFNDIVQFKDDFCVSLPLNNKLFLPKGTNGTIKFFKNPIVRLVVQLKIFYLIVDTTTSYIESIHSSNLSENDIKEQRNIENINEENSRSNQARKDNTKTFINKEK